MLTHGQKVRHMLDAYGTFDRLVFDNQMLKYDPESWKKNIKLRHIMHFPI